MENTCWITEWAKIRQDEVVDCPERFDLHSCYLQHMSEEELFDAFFSVSQLFKTIYRDVQAFPESFGMPLHERSVYNQFSTQARESRNAPYRPIKLLYDLLNSGELCSEQLVVDVSQFKLVNDVKHLPKLFERLSEYGFYIEGLKHNKIANATLEISYPDNACMLIVLKLMASKASNTNRLTDFYSCHYKLFKDDMTTANYGLGADQVADKMHAEHDKQFVYEMDALLKDRGYFSQALDWNEGPTYAYYEKESELKSKGPYHFMLVSWKSKLLLYLRIRNAEKCMAYLETCPDTVKAVFKWGDIGCAKRMEKSCISGQTYTIDGTEYWRCGCCNAPFYFEPRLEDIPHYLELVKLGAKKNTA